MPFLESNHHTSKRLAGIKEKGQTGNLGYHDMILMSAKVLQESGLTMSDARELMQEASKSVTRRPLQHSEIEKALEWAFSQKSDSPGYRAIKKYTTDWNLVQEFSGCLSFDNLSATSDIKPKTTVKALIDLFEPNDHIFMCEDPRKPGVVVIPQHGDIFDKYKYICPSPLDDPNGGRVKANIKIHKYIIYESDIEGIAYNFDLQSGLISRLMKILPLKMVVHSGNKSLHAWFNCAGQDPERLQEFTKMGILLGADSAVFRPNQLVRTPLVYRDNETIQDIIYYAR